MSTSWLVCQNFNSFLYSLVCIYSFFVTFLLFQSFFFISRAHLNYQQLFYPIHNILWMLYCSLRRLSFCMLSFFVQFVLGFLQSLNYLASYMFGSGILKNPRMLWNNCILLYGNDFLPSFRWFYHPRLHPKQAIGFLSVFISILFSP